MLVYKLTPTSYNKLLQSNHINIIRRTQGPKLRSTESPPDRASPFKKKIAHYSKT